MHISDSTIAAVARLHNDEYLDMTDEDVVADIARQA